MKFTKTCEVCGIVYEGCNKQAGFAAANAMAYLKERTSRYAQYAAKYFWRIIERANIAVLTVIA